MASILIVNAWGNNRGDEAMLDVISSKFQEFTEEKIKIDIAPFRREKINISEGQNFVKRRCGVHQYSLLASFLPPKIAYGLRSRGLIPSMDARRFLKRYDFVMHAPQGPTLGDMYENKKTYAAFPLELCHGEGIPYGIIGASVGPFEQKEEYIKDILNGAHKLVFREDYSVRHVKEAYPEINKAEGLIDTVFMCDETKMKSVNLNKRIRKKTNNQVGFCISMVPSHDPRKEMDVNKYLEKQTRIIDKVHSITGKKIFLFPHITSRKNKKARHYIANNDKVSRFTEALESADEWKQQVRIIDNLSFYITTRYHPTIFSILKDTPFLCIKNQFKVEAMLRKINLDVPTCWQDDEADKVVNRFRECWSRREEIKGKISSAKKRAQDIATGYDDVIRSICAKF